MNDTVTKLLDLADEYAFYKAEAMRNQYETWHTRARRKQDDAETDKARQALQDELVRLFTPLTDEQLESVANAADRRFLACMNESDGWWAVYGRMIEAEHGITGEKNEQAT